MRSGRFHKGLDDAMRRLNASVAFDRRLWREDIAGSLAWAEGLLRKGLISVEEATAIRDGLGRVAREIESGTFRFREELEDIHMNIEARLTELIGDAGARLHTGRSRNDQVATDMRLYLKRAAKEVAAGIIDLVRAVADAADRSFGVIVPAYTHLQRAQPVLLSHHFLAYAEMLLRDRDRFLWAESQADACPLGSGACAGNQFGVDREFIAETLGFARITRNSMDAVSDRDFVCDFLHAALLTSIHLSRFSEDLILWSTAEFGLVTLDDSVTTGSSLLPQKKNPDACELTRGKCGRILGHLVALATVLKGLPLTYNRDLQEDKEGVFDAIDTLETILPVFRVLIDTMEVRSAGAEALLRGGHLGALGLADHLTLRGVPFREAHRVAGAAVRLAEERGVSLADLPLEEYRRLHESFDEGLFAAIGTEAMLADKVVTGGTAPERVREEIRRLRDSIDAPRGP